MKHSQRKYSEKFSCLAGLIALPTSVAMLYQASLKKKTRFVKTNEEKELLKKKMKVANTAVKVGVLSGVVGAATSVILDVDNDYSFTNVFDVNGGTGYIKDRIDKQSEEIRNEYYSSGHGSRTKDRGFDDEEIY